MKIGYVIYLADATNKANIIYKLSIKCKWITYSVLVPKLYGMVHRFEIRVVIITTLEKMLKFAVFLILCTDSKSFYNCLVKHGAPQKK